MREQAIAIFSKIIEWGIILLVFLAPLFFLPQVTDAFEFSKQLFLFFSVTLLIFLWVLKMILERKVVILHSSLTLPILLFLGVSFLSTIFSVHRFSSFFGPYPRLYGGLVSLLVYSLFFFLVASNIRERAQIFRILIGLSASGFLLALFGIFNFFDVPLFGDFFPSKFVTPAGSADRTSLFLLLLLPFSLFTFFASEKKIPSFFSGILSFLFLFYISLISNFPALLSLFLLFFLFLLFARFRLSKKMALRMGAFFLIFLLLFAINNWNPIRGKIPFLKGLPVSHDITLDQNTGWAITTGVFQSLKLLAFGSGPGTYISDFTAFKPTRFNQTPFWDLRFEKSSNEYFHIASTLGFLGLIFFLFLLFSVFKLFKEYWKEEFSSEDAMGAGIFSSLFLFFFASFFTPSFTLTAFLFWLFLSLSVVFVFSLRLTGVREGELSLAVVQTKGLPEVKGEILPWLAGIIFLLISAPFFWQEIKIFIAELHFAKAQAEQLKEQPDGDFILRSLGQARNIMPANDSYRRALSATSLDFAILGERQGLLTEEIKQQLLLTAKREAEFAVQLAPHNIFNWENLQRTYTFITLENQDDLLIDTVFPQEISLDPANPRHRNDLGWAYLNLRNDTELAKRHFWDAIILKPDFPDAHYNLARVYKEEGKKDRALQELDQTLNFLDNQISSLQEAAGQGQDLQRALNQLKQFRGQVESEKAIVLEELEKEKQQGEKEREEGEKEKVSEEEGKEE